jgi:alpha-tubulin suppressor-like RCC1 family protein
MALTQIQAGSIEPGAINTSDLGANVTATYATYAAVAANLTPRITTVNVANSSYTVLDDTSVNTSGGYLVITGANFQSGAIVTVQDTNATSTTYVNDTTLRAQVPAKTAGSYNLYVTNPDGGTAIKVLGVSYSNTPIWGTAATLSNQAANTAFAVNISANSDSAVTYSNTTALPAGTTLLANGLFYGTVTIGAETVYSFDVNAVDAENQDTPRTFSLTVTVGPPAGSLYAAGYGLYGRLGTNSENNVSSPVQVGSDTSWTTITTGTQTSVGIKSNGTLWVWGFYPRATGSTTIISSPTQVGSSTNWSKVSTGEDHTLAIKTDGTLWAWGNGDFGKLSQSTLNDITSPVQIGSSTDWSTVVAGYQASYALKTNGTLWTWGANDNGNLGLGDTNNRSSPTQVGTSTNWSMITTPVGGQKNVGALKTDGTIWLWGQGSYGALGQNVSSGNIVSPVQLGTGNDWAYINATQLSFHAIKTNGNLWSWGYNNGGRLGQGDTVSRSSPVQVGSDTDWETVKGRYSHVWLTKTNDNLYFIGNDVNGSSGLNSPNINRTTATQLTGTFKAFDGGQYFSLFIK